MHALITNDDGVQATGLLTLKQAFEAAGHRVTVVAPDRPRSASGHAITLHKPLRVDRVPLADGGEAHACTGTPSDCVLVGLRYLMPDDLPDLIVSGINQGPNLSWDLTYSGTASAAMEGALAGVPSIAMSLAFRFERLDAAEEEPPTGLDYHWAAQFAVRLAEAVLADPLPAHAFLNVNVPPGEPLGVEVTRQGFRKFPGTVEARRDPRGRVYLWLGGDTPEAELLPGTDVNAIAERRISVTPVHLDLTAHDLIDQVKGWEL